MFAGIFEGIWRRIYGGGLKNWFEYKGINTWWSKLLCSRAVHTIINIPFLMWVFYKSFSTNNIFFFCKDWANDYKLWICLFAAILFQFLFWSLKHGPIFDFGHGPVPVPQSTIDSYNAMPHTKYLNKFWNKYLINYFPLYSYTYDAVSMFVRYTWPLCIICWFTSFSILPLGLLVTSMYAICWAVFDCCPEYFFDKRTWLNLPTKVAEVLAGFCVGFYL